MDYYNSSLPENSSPQWHVEDFKGWNDQNIWGHDNQDRGVMNQFHQGPPNNFEPPNHNGFYLQPRNSDQTFHQMQPLAESYEEQQNPSREEATGVPGQMDSLDRLEPQPTVFTSEILLEPLLDPYVPSYQQTTPYRERESLESQPQNNTPKVPTELPLDPCVASRQQIPKGFGFYSVPPLSDQKPVDSSFSVVINRVTEPAEKDNCSADFKDARSSLRISLTKVEEERANQNGVDDKNDTAVDPVIGSGAKYYSKDRKTNEQDRNRDRDRDIKQHGSRSSTEEEFRAERNRDRNSENDRRFAEDDRARRPSTRDFGRDRHYDNDRYPENRERDRNWKGRRNSCNCNCSQDDRFLYNDRERNQDSHRRDPRRDYRRRDVERSEKFYGGSRSRTSPHDFHHKEYSRRDQSYGDDSRRNSYDSYHQQTPNLFNQTEASYMSSFNNYMIDAYKNNYAALEAMRIEHSVAYHNWYHSYVLPQNKYKAPVALRPNLASRINRKIVHPVLSNQTGNDPSFPPTESNTVLDDIYPDGFSQTIDQENYRDLTIDEHPHPYALARLQLIQLLSKSPTDGSAQVDFNSLYYLPTIQEFDGFPGPLLPDETNKRQICEFCVKKIHDALNSPDPIEDRSSYVLLWEMLILMVKLNGKVVGTDIAELLLKDHEITREPTIENLPQSSERSEDRTQMNRDSETSTTRKFCQLLLVGNKPKALEWAMSQGLWGHSMFLASKMGKGTLCRVMERFVNGVASADPLKTLYQVMSELQPNAVSNYTNGDWRPHLAMILSNESSKTDINKKSIVALGNTLANRGLIFASQFCYLVSLMEFGSYADKSKLVLLTSSTSLPFDLFATPEAIQCTEVYEYARQLIEPDFAIESLQPYKFLYATCLADHGRISEALRYCEAIANIVIKDPLKYSAFVDQIVQIGSILKLKDHMQTEPDGSIPNDPAWLTALISATRSTNQPPNNEEDLENCQRPCNFIDRQQLQQDWDDPARIKDPSTDQQNAPNCHNPPNDYSCYQQPRDQQGQQQQQYYHHHQQHQQHFIPQQSYGEHLSSIQNPATHYSDPYQYHPNPYYGNQPVNPETNGADPVNNSFQQYPMQQQQEQSSLLGCGGSPSDYQYPPQVPEIAASAVDNTTPKPKRVEKKNSVTAGGGGGFLRRIFGLVMPKPKNPMKLPTDTNPSVRSKRDSCI